MCFCTVVFLCENLEMQSTWNSSLHSRWWYVGKSLVCQPGKSLPKSFTSTRKVGELFTFAWQNVGTFRLSRGHKHTKCQHPGCNPAHPCADFSDFVSFLEYFGRLSYHNRITILFQTFLGISISTSSPKNH